MRSGGPFLATARSDAEDRLIEAQEPLAGLQRRCGGEIPGRIATPALLELVRNARHFGLRLARPIQARDSRENITAWVEVVPDAGGAGGCEIGLVNWRAVPLVQEEEHETAARRADIDRNLAEVSARLDAQQRLLAVEGNAPELSALISKMREGLGRPWTDFVEIVGSSHRQPIHWRLLDGARIRLEGSSREWKASLIPMGAAETGESGFELHFVSDQPPDEGAPPPRPAARAGRRPEGPVIGRDIAPILRQPVARIIANAETIRTMLAGPLAEEYSNYAADIAAAGQHLLALIEDLADLEVVEAEEFTTAPDLIDLADVARRAVGILGVRARDKGIRIVAPGHDETVPAIGEFRRVLQVLLNLIGNAIRYSPAESQIWVRLDADGGRASVTIADQGEGLTEEQQAKVFDKFERLGRSGDGGSGLGLYISRKLAAAMGGELTVESAPGQGARFTLTLPAPPAA